MLIVIGGPDHALATADEFSRLLPLTALTLTAGPTVAGLLMTGLLSGPGGVRDILRRLLHWRVGARWYAVALLTAPVLAVAILVPFAVRSPAFLPPVLTKPAGGLTLVFTAFAALFGGLFEEIGWTGFAIPRLRQRYSVFSTGLIVGIVWGAWHFLVNLWGSPALAGGLPLTLFVPLYFLAGVAHLTGYRVLMVWAYDRTDSLLIAILMHAALIASTVQTVLTPPTTGVAFLTWFFGLTALFWLAVAAIAVSKRRAA
jgi:membrane protease YdiL (CAAX protease family)